MIDKIKKINYRKYFDEFKKFVVSNIKIGLKYHKKFFIVLGFLISYSFIFSPFAINYLKQKPLDIFIQEETNCQADFFIAPVCNSIALKTGSVSKTPGTTKENAPTFNPNEEVKFDISAYNSEYEILSIGYDNSNYFQRLENIKEGDKFKLPKDLGYYFLSVNMYGDSSCSILCTGTVYEAKEKFKCLNADNFVNTGRSCTNSCKGWIKIGGGAIATPIPTTAPIAQPSPTPSSTPSFQPSPTPSSTPSLNQACLSTDPDNDNCLKCINNKWSYYFNDSRGSLGWCSCCKKYGICTSSTYKGQSGEVFYGIEDNQLLLQQCN